MEDVREQYQKICSLIDEANEREGLLLRQVQALENQFIAQLAAHALGEITGNELQVARAELVVGKRELEEIPLLIQGLEARREQAWPEVDALRKKELRAEYEKNFEKFKRELQEKFTEEGEGRLRLVAHRLQRSKEIDPFIEKLRFEWENTPLKDRQPV